MGRKHTKIWLFILTVTLLLIGGLTALIISIRPTPIEQKVDQLFKTKLSTQVLITAGARLDRYEELIKEGLAGPDTGKRQFAMDLTAYLINAGGDLSDLVEQACWNSDKAARHQAGHLIKTHYPDRLPPLVEPGK